MSEISETEIKAMTKEQNYMRGYKDGKSDMLDKIRAEIEHMIPCSKEALSMKLGILDIINKYKADKEQES